MAEPDINDLRAGLAAGELLFHYQPKISLVNGKVSGAEALMRWTRADGRTVSPGVFIPLARAAGFLHDLTVAMFEKLLEDLLIIQDLDDELVLSFNLTAEDLERPEITRRILDALASRQIRPGCLQIELTEESVLNNGNPVIQERMRTLVDHGVRLAMDDFGVGYSSLDTLSQWPFSVIKLDRGLIRRMQESPQSTAIVQASIRMAHMLGIAIVAEGIESSEVYDFLMHYGCTEAQGFWMAQPMPLEAFIAFHKQGQRWSGLPLGLIHVAQLDHIHWRRALIDQVVSRSFNPVAAHDIKRFDIELDHHACRLGRWYYGPGQEFVGVVAFDALEVPHRRLHDVGKELVAAASRNAPQAEIAALLRALTRESGTVLSLLQELENEAAIR